MPHPKRRAIERDVKPAAVLSSLGIESKFFDEGEGPTAIVSPSDSAGGEVDPTGDCLNAMVVGNTDQTRIGRVITMTKISIRGVINTIIQVDQTVPDTPPLVMIALVLDTQANGLTLSSEAVFTNPSASSLGAVAPFREMDQVSRFKVLRRVQLTMPAPGQSGDSTNFEIQGTQAYFNMFYKFPSGGLKVNYKATAGAVADIVDNALHVIAYCSSATLAPTITYNSRLRYLG